MQNSRTSSDAHCPSDTCRAGENDFRFKKKRIKYIHFLEIEFVELDINDLLELLARLERAPLDVDILQVVVVLSDRCKLNKSNLKISIEYF